MKYCPIKIWRAQNNISQHKLSEMLDINVQAVRNWEKARTFPRAKQMIEIQRITREPLFYAVWFLWYEKFKQEEMEI